MQPLKLITHPKVVAHASFFIPLMIQAAIFHPYYQNQPNFRLARRALTPIIILFVLNSVEDRLWKPLGECMMINFPFVALITFHAICLAIQFGFYDGPVFKSDSKSGKKDVLAVDSNVEDSSPDEAPREDLQKLNGTGSEEKEIPKVDGSSKDDKSTAESSSCPSWGQLTRFVLWLLLR